MQPVDVSLPTFIVVTQEERKVAALMFRAEHNRNVEKIGFDENEKKKFLFLEEEKKE